MQRVLVIGISGAGKSTFARQLASRTGLPLIPAAISSDLWPLVSARGVAMPEARFQHDAAARKQQRIPAPLHSNEKSIFLTAGMIHLDREFWQPGWVTTKRDVWRPKVQALAADNRWIMDGNYGASLDLRLPRAVAQRFQLRPRPPRHGARLP